MSLGGRDVAGDPVSFRTERKVGDLLHLVQIICPAQAQLLGGTQVSGILVDTDTICSDAPADFWTNLSARLDVVHDANKRMFFELLTDETVASLEPEY